MLSCFHATRGVRSVRGYSRILLTVDSSVSHALPVVEQNSAPPQFVVYGVGRAADLLCDAAKGASVSMSDLDDDALFISEMCPFAMLRFCGTL